MARQKSTDGVPKGGAKKRTAAQAKKASTQFQHGNNLWMARSSHGRNPIFKDADALLDAISQYFTWVEQNPHKEQKVASANGMPTIIEVDKVRAMTIDGLCLFIGIGRRTWDDWKVEDSGHHRSDLSQVIAFAELAIREQKFSAAAAGLLNANIISRDLGLVDKKSNDNNHTINVIDNFEGDE